MTDFTGPPLSRRQHAEERREQILDAALHIFSEKGFAGTSIREIAREVGVTEGLLYHYFESKEQLLHACWKERSWQAHLERILAGAEGKPLSDVLRDLIGDFLATLREHGPKVRMCAIEMQRNPEMAAEHRQRISISQTMICDFLRSRQASGEIRATADVEAAAGLFMGSAYSLFLLFGESPDDEWNRYVDGMVQNGIDIVLHGLACKFGDVVAI